MIGFLILTKYLPYLWSVRLLTRTSWNEFTSRDKTATHITTHHANKSIITVVTSSLFLLETHHVQLIDNDNNNDNDQEHYHKGKQQWRSLTTNCAEGDLPVRNLPLHLYDRLDLGVSILLADGAFRNT